MKLLLLTGALALASAYYTDVDDKFDNNDTEVKGYMDCHLDKGPCTPSMTSYKKHIKEMDHTTWSYCTPIQKHIAEEFLKTMVVKYPLLFKEFQQKYDPDSKGFPALLDELSKYDW